MITDHKLLLAILGLKKGMPSLAAARMQKWSFLLSAYQYEILFKPTDKHYNADGLYRLPEGQPPTLNSLSEVTLSHMGKIYSLPVDAVEI